MLEVISSASRGLWLSLAMFGPLVLWMIVVAISRCVMHQSRA